MSGFGGQVHVVVVAYHSPAALDICLAALAGADSVTVVDNSSSPDVASVAHRNRAVYVDAGENLGFARGVNLGLKRLAPEDDYVLLLNPDAVIYPGAATELVRFMQEPQNVRVAAVAPRLVTSGDVAQRVEWPYPSPLRMCAEAAGLGRLLTSRTFVIGAVLLLRREAVDEVGGFDERFFLYAEETDWQRRALESGWTSLVCGQAVAEHAGGGTSEHERTRERLFHAAQETYIRKWYGPSGWTLYRAAVIVGAATRAILLGGERRRAAERRLVLYLRGPRRCAAIGVD